MTGRRRNKLIQRMATFNIMFYINLPGVHDNVKNKNWCAPVDKQSGSRE
jgi:hypothetical protein